MPLLDNVITGVCNGLGSSLGAYIATRYAIKNYERIVHKKEDPHDKPK